MKYTGIILLALVFYSCQTTDKSTTDSKGSPSENELSISTGEIDTDIITEEKYSLNFSRSRKDKIEDIWEDILEHNQDLNKDMATILEKLESLDEEIQAIESQIAYHNSYFAAIESKVKFGVKDSMRQKSLLASIEESKSDLKNKVDLLKDRKSAAISIKDKFQEHLNILKFSSVNSLVHRYFNEELGDGSELFIQTEDVRETVNNFIKRHPAEY